MFRFLLLLLYLAALVVSGQAESGQPAFSHSRILAVHHPAATVTFAPQSRLIQQMVHQGILQFTGATDIKDAWQTLVSTQDTIGIKVHSAPGRTTGTRPAVVGALVESLLQAGISPAKIIVWDRRMIDLRLADYPALADRYGIRLAGAIDEGFDPEVFYSTPLIGKLVYGDLEFDKKGEGIGRNSHVSRLLTRQITKIINVAPLLNHNAAGVSGILYGLATSSVDNILRFENFERLAVAVPEIFALPELADRVVLNVVDALICQYLGEERSLLHYSSPLNELWFSRDPVALDVLALDELKKQHRDSNKSNPALQIYLNAALMELGVADRRRIRIERLEL